MKIKFSKDKETRNTVRFGEEGDREDHKVGSIYLKKDAVEELGGPESIEVTIEKVS